MLQALKSLPTLRLPLRGKDGSSPRATLRLLLRGKDGSSPRATLRLPSGAKPLFRCRLPRRGGRVKHREDITDGLENAPRELIGLVRGENFGKKIIRVNPEPAQCVARTLAQE